MYVGIRVSLPSSFKMSLVPPSGYAINTTKLAKKKTKKQKPVHNHSFKYLPHNHYVLDSVINARHTVTKKDVVLVLTKLT